MGHGQESVAVVDTLPYLHYSRGMTQTRTPAARRIAAAAALITCDIVAGQFTNLHGECVEIVRALKLDTKEAVELVDMLRRLRVTCEPGSPEFDGLGIAKTAVNAYANDYSLR